MQSEGKVTKADCAVRAKGMFLALALLLALTLLALTGCRTPKGQRAEAQNGTCTVSISCEEILENWDALNPAKEEFVPSDGWVLLPSEVAFSEGDTAFDALKAACRDAKIQIESSYTPLYGSNYVEGIHQIYELDCGPNSGWTYRVNGEYPNYGSSEYVLADGDTVEWVYTCHLGIAGEAENFET